MHLLPYLPTYTSAFSETSTNLHAASMGPIEMLSEGASPNPGSLLACRIGKALDHGRSFFTYLSPFSFLLLPTFFLLNSAS
jgi:hypothetical protein